jgi:hypothetical protein
MNHMETMVVGFIGFALFVYLFMIDLIYVAVMSACFVGGELYALWCKKL